MCVCVCARALQALEILETLITPGSADVDVRNKSAVRAACDFALCT